MPPSHVESKTTPVRPADALVVDRERLAAFGRGALADLEVADDELRRADRPGGTEISGSSLPDGVTSGIGVGSPVTFSMIGVGVAVAVGGGRSVGVVSAAGLESPQPASTSAASAASVVSRNVMVKDRSAGGIRRRSQGSAVDYVAATGWCWTA